MIAETFTQKLTRGYIRWVALLLACLASPTTHAFAQATSSRSPAPFLVVELGRSFERLQEAVDALEGRDGTIRIAAGRYRDCAVVENGAVAFEAAAGADAVFAGGVCEGKATLVLRGRSAWVEGLTFTGTFVPDGNGAGIRIEKGHLTVLTSRFQNAQSGILSADDPGSTIKIDRSTFSGLGKHPDGRGAHSIYVGRYGGLHVTNTRFERGTGGHYLKSRAPVIEVLDSDFDDSRGRNTNYMIDLPYGAVGRIERNKFINGLDKDNYSIMIALAGEERLQPSAGLKIQNNTAWLVPGFPSRTALVASWTSDRILLRNNIIGPGMVQFERRLATSSWIRSLQPVQALSAMSSIPRRLARADAAMIDDLALAISHGLMLLVAWRLSGRPDLDEGSDPKPIGDSPEGGARA